MGTTIGVIGIGRIGLPVCAQLVGSGHTVVAHDRLTERAGSVRRAGATWTSSSEALAEAADVVITVLPGSDELCQAMDVALPAMRRGAAWIDLTSSSPLVARPMWHRADRRGIDSLDSPVGGGVCAAQTGSLQLFVGGRAEAVDRYGSILEAFGTVNHVGDQGAGYTTKLVVNLLWFAQALATGEALLLAGRAGIDLEVLREVIQASAARSEFVERDLDALLDGDYRRSFGLDRCHEELEAVTRLAEHHGTSREVSVLVRRAYARALDRFGPVDGELLPVAVLEEESGLLLRRDRGRDDGGSAAKVGF
jgi:3-hydroxyisobutyrate dehydrogenase